VDSDLLEQVKTFVAEFSSVRKDRISADTRVNDDLGIDGDDGEDFLKAYCARFGVDPSIFPPDKYFGPEAGANPLTVVSSITRRLTTGSWSGLAPLTVSDLVKAVEQRAR
jgi:hypothetical protein